MNISLSAFAPENLVPRDGFGNPVSRQPAHFHTQAESGAYLRDSSRVPRRRLHYKAHRMCNCKYVSLNLLQVGPIARVLLLYLCPFLAVVVSLPTLPGDKPKCRVYSIKSISIGWRV